MDWTTTILVAVLILRTIGDVYEIYDHRQRGRKLDRVHKAGIELVERFGISDTEDQHHAIQVLGAWPQMAPVNRYRMMKALKWVDRARNDDRWPGPHKAEGLPKAEAGP